MTNTNKNNIYRFITATSIFDGHDASIQIVRRFLHEKGVEVIHLGHNRSAEEVVLAAIQEDANAIAISSYQGGHIEYLSYILELLDKYQSKNIKVFAGGGGVITGDELKLLESRGVSKIFTPHDGMKMGFSGMIDTMISKCQNSSTTDYLKYLNLTKDLDIESNKHLLTGKLISLIDNPLFDEYLNKFKSKIVSAQNNSKRNPKVPVLGFTGTGGAGKSSLIDELILRFLKTHEDKRIAILSIDPTRVKTGGALLADRIRINSLLNKRVFFRSMATRMTANSTHSSITDVVKIFRLMDFDAIIVETAGVGQSDIEITKFSDVCTYVMTSDYGSPSQLEKLAILDYTNYIVLNKSDKAGSRDAFQDVQRVYRNIHKKFDTLSSDLPIFLTNTREFNNIEINKLFNNLFQYLENKKYNSLYSQENQSNYLSVLYSSNYLKYIVDAIRNYKADIKASLHNIRMIQSYYYILNNRTKHMDNLYLERLKENYNSLKFKISKFDKKIIKNYEYLKKVYTAKEQCYSVRNKDINIQNYVKTISNTSVPKVILPDIKDWGHIVKFFKLENLPGFFPYTSGVFPFKRENEITTRMFAGEGSPEKTNARFHYLSKNQSFARLSTAFDSVTLYGSAPNNKLDVYGKIGNAGVSICSLDDMKRLYSGFNLCHPNTSVSMTINGPAPILLGFFFNAAIDAECERYLKRNGKWSKTIPKIKKWFSKNGLVVPKYRNQLPNDNDSVGLGFLGVTSDNIVNPNLYNNIKSYVLNNIRGTVQADILKEDQAQNTCIFSIEFALRLMVDMQKYFIDNSIKNFYSISVSGYHIAEAGANPITQLAFTLSNGFTLAECYIANKLNINDFIKNFSFFFSNGLDIEYNVIGRVARRIWAISMKYIYKANERGQKLKYHIQTSGRSLHAQEMNFNDIRTTLQAYTAVADNCNSLHTNAYDEALTTPTEESVRRALAIQLIINKEFGIIKNQNFLQGSYIIEWLTDKVEEKVLDIFESLNERGGVLGAMDKLYQRNRIQKESMKYEYYKHTGKSPIIGVNSFVNNEAIVPKTNVFRSSINEKNMQVTQTLQLSKNLSKIQDTLIKNVQKSVVENQNIFTCLMEACKYCSIGTITDSLYNVGGHYRRNM